MEMAALSMHGACPSVLYSSPELFSPSKGYICSEEDCVYLAGFLGWKKRREIIAIFSLKLSLDLTVITLVNYFPVIVL